MLNFDFNNNDRLGFDSCIDDQRAIQNKKASGYLLENFRPYCPMDSAINLATSQPNVFFNGSSPVGINGCNVNENSDLLFSKISKPACKLTLEPRLFLTVPYLGRGASNIPLEDELRQSQSITNKKSVNNLSEVSYQSYSNYPLIDEIQSKINNPQYLVEGVADKNWIRGGLPSREVARNQNNNNQNNNIQHNLEINSNQPMAANILGGTWGTNNANNFML
tara:strand:+ start:4539 stop:5201 length:663 start_codon:yes stop_codon:yes gene_type:complete